MEEKLVLQMDSIVKTFPGVKALDGVHLDVRRGDEMCIRDRYKRP